MERYGFTREALLILLTVIFLFSSVSITAAAKTIIIQHKGEINILRLIGASKKLLKRDLLIKILPWSIISSLIGVALAMAALTITHECGYIKILSHAASFQIDPFVIMNSLQNYLSFPLLCLLHGVS